jgi:hypothetical protein
MAWSLAERGVALEGHQGILTMHWLGRNYD